MAFAHFVVGEYSSGSNGRMFSVNLIFFSKLEKEKVF